MRVILQHHDEEDGRRLSIEEEDFTNPEANPFNGATVIARVNGNTGERIDVHRPARPADDHISLEDEGFVIVGEYATEDLYDDNGVQIAFKGVSEIARDPELYAGKGLAKAANPTSAGKAVAKREGGRTRD